LHHLFAGLRTSSCIMPAKTEFSGQSEVGALGLREARRSDPAACRGGASRPATRKGGTAGVGALRSARGTCENSSANIGTGTNGRRSPRLGLGSCASSNSSRPTYAYGCRDAKDAANGGRVFGDITNVSAARSSQAEKGAFAKAHQSHPILGGFAARSAAAAPEAPAAEAPAVEVPVDAINQVTAAMSQLAISQVETSNVQNVEEYVSDICNQFFRDEAKFLARANYMETQTDITCKMRTILIDWLVEVHAKYRLRPETLHLTVNLIDRYLTKMPIMRKRLQLVGVVAMFIASKFEEISPPELHDWVYITDNAYTKDDILVMECTMLSALSFQIVVPTAAHFFDVFEKANNCDPVHLEVARYLLELGLLDLRSLQYNPSQMVAAALLLSNELSRRTTVWPTVMVQQTRHTEQSLGSCSGVLRELLEADRAGAGGQLKAVHKKFSAAQRHAVAKMVF